VVLVPRGDPHVLSSAPGMRADPYVESYREMRREQRPFRVLYEGGAPPAISPAGASPAATGGACAAKLVCGFIGCDLKPFNPLIATLPRLLHLPAAHSSWSAGLLELAVDESAGRRPGGEALLERMSEMMFVDAIRRHVDTLPEDSRGWLAGLRDPYVGRALALLHAAPAERWTVDELGQRVGLSRSAITDRFVELIGEPPMHYLAQWRMQLASRLLRDTRATVGAIALEVGYDSEAAFARAFKRATGTPPAAWRRSRA
jgi:AraC-like DNA-binding protein